MMVPEVLGTSRAAATQRGTNESCHFGPCREGRFPFYTKMVVQIICVKRPDQYRQRFVLKDTNHSSFFLSPVFCLLFSRSSFSFCSSFSFFFFSTSFAIFSAASFMGSSPFFPPNFGR